MIQQQEHLVLTLIPEALFTLTCQIKLPLSQPTPAKALIVLFASSSLDQLRVRKTYTFIT